MGEADQAPQDRLAVRLKEAARILGVSERVLWQWTRDGIIPHVRQGRVILYPVDALREWLRDNVSRQSGGDNERP